MLRGDTDTDYVKVLALVVLNLCGIVVAQFDNYYNWPETAPPVVKTEFHVAGKETKIRCNIKDRFRHIQNGLNLTWEHKPCRVGQAAACMEEGEWQELCGLPRQPCPPVLPLVEPNPRDSGLYRCHITLDTSVITLNIYMLEFVEKRRDPPVIMDSMTSNLTVVAPLVAVLQCKVRSPVPPTMRWFRRLEPPGSPNPPAQHFIQYLNNTYQLLNCCPVAALSQKDVYLSKLVISATSVFDSGFYICLAINDANYTYKEAYINVLPVLRASGKKTETGSFLGLFLIPAALAMIPAMAWMMWLRPRKLATLESPVQSQRQPSRTLQQSAPQTKRQPVQTHRPSVKTDNQPPKSHIIPLLSTSTQLDSSYLPVTMSHPVQH